MSTLDWLVLAGTIMFIVVYGIWKSRGQKDARSYLLNSESTKGWMIGLSIMATQASAITFLSTPGQAFQDGMRFIQFYFGVPIAMVIISMVFIPIFQRLKVFTAYEYLEQRFDLKTRTLAASLFLVSRGMGGGMTIYAPALILSALLGLNVQLLCIGIGLLVLVYTVSGGTQAVSQTQKQQMFVILGGMLLAAILMVRLFPEGVSFFDGIKLAGKLGKLNAVTVPSARDFDFKDRYNLYSGIIGGAFLALAYFGTDQSQVQRYLGGKSLTESRIGLLFNGLLKVPMQFLILFCGVLLYVFYLFTPPPLFFNERVSTTMRAQTTEFSALEDRHEELFLARKEAAAKWLEQKDAANETALLEADQALKSLGKEARDLIKTTDRSVNVNDQDRVFLTFILQHLPHGLIGLLIAVILSAAMSSSSAELNSLGGTTMIDFHKRFGKKQLSGAQEVAWSRIYTVVWGLLAISFALVAGQFENLIQAVNILGSLFYGTVLGIFLTAFFLKRVKGTAVFVGAVLGELVVIGCFVLPPRFPETLAWLDVGFLWYNLFGCGTVVLVGLLWSLFDRD